MAEEALIPRVAHDLARIEAMRPFRAIPELVIVGADTSHTARDLGPHSHPGLFAVCCIRTGSVQWRVGREQHELHGGQVFCAWPGEVLGGVDDVLHPCSLYWLLLELPKPCTRGFLGLPTTEARALHRRLWRLPRRVFAAAESIPACFASLLSASQSSDRLAEIGARSALVGLLVDVCHYSAEPSDRTTYATPVASALDLMASHIAEPLSIPALAKRVGLSTSHFHRLFKTQTGLAPGDYYLRRRVAAAREMISLTGLPLVEIALRCGFGSSQYFATCFRRVTGQRPSEYRRLFQADHG